MDNGNWELDFEMLAEGREGKLGTVRELSRVDILE